MSDEPVPDPTALLVEIRDELRALNRHLSAPRPGDDPADDGEHTVPVDGR